MVQHIEGVVHKGILSLHVSRCPISPDQKIEAESASKARQEWGVSGTGRQPRNQCSPGILCNPEAPQSDTRNERLLRAAPDLQP